VREREREREKERERERERQDNIIPDVAELDSSLIFHT
jgi:hypothetical protein